MASCNFILVSTCKLCYFSVLSVLYNLRVRFEQQCCVYTYCGIVLVAINPYTTVPIYGREVGAAYGNHQMGELDPHIYAVAEQAYRTLVRWGFKNLIFANPRKLWSLK